MKWLKKLFTTTRCECGRVDGCHRKYGGLVNYDIVGDGVAQINWDKAMKCERFKHAVAELFESV